MAIMCKLKLIMSNQGSTKHKSKIIMDNRVNIIKMIEDSRERFTEKPVTVIYKYITCIIKVKNCIKSKKLIHL